MRTAGGASSFKSAETFRTNSLSTFAAHFINAGFPITLRIVVTEG
jgi:hypothetical protein